ncbi:MAG: asparaginase [Oscillospiraceae bacterium]|nr:asparaginase [Oscillospiraceae bacterium]
MKKVLMLGTGGTIASDLIGGGLTPVLNSQELLARVPEICQICSVTCKELFSIDSTNITPAHWLQIASAIEENFNQYDGFVIAHGTDTMAYTAAALSYLVQYSPKPIVLTGAQKPILFENTDSKTNLLDAFRVAVSELCGVVIVFNGRVILGTRARKTHTTSLQAFSSINYPVLAVVQNGFLMEYIRPASLPAPVFYSKLHEKVGLMKMIPGADCGLLSYLLEHNDAVIIESYGVGGLPSYQGSGFFDVIRKAIDHGKTIVMTTQVQNEGSNLAVYDVGFHLKNSLKLLEAYDMTTEAALAKLMWILGRTQEPREVRRLFCTPISHDLLYLKEEAT